jgi:multiple sugar transport system substrate-binding protein
MIRFSFFGSYEEWQLFQRMKQEFEAAHPEIVVKLEYWPGGNYEDKLKLVMAAGNAPDVMAIQDEPFPAYCTRQQYEDLTPYMEAAGDAFAPCRFFRTALETFRYHGRYYGVPWNGGQVMIYYNRALFRRAGIPEPAPDWTWDDFLRTCRALTQDWDGDGRIDQFGFEIQTGGSSGWMNLLPWIWDAGADVLDPEMTHCTINTPRGSAGWNSSTTSASRSTWCRARPSSRAPSAGYSS